MLLQIEKFVSSFSVQASFDKKLIIERKNNLKKQKNFEFTSKNKFCFFSFEFQCIRKENDF